MSKKILLIITGLIITSLVVCVLAWSRNTHLDPDAESVFPQPNSQQNLSAQKRISTEHNRAPHKASLKKSAKLEPEEQTSSSQLIDNSAILSFKDSIDNPPNYLPPLSRSPESDKLSKDILDDHDKYAELEMQSRRKLKQSFVEKSREKLKKIDALIERGRQEGIDEALLEEAYRKREAIAKLAAEFEKHLGLKKIKNQ